MITAYSILNRQHSNFQIGDKIFIEHQSIENFIEKNKFKN